MVDYFTHYIWGDVQVCYPNGVERICEWIKPEHHDVVFNPGWAGLAAVFIGIFVLYVLAAILFGSGDNDKETRRVEALNTYAEAHSEIVRILATAVSSRTMTSEMRDRLNAYKLVEKKALAVMHANGGWTSNDNPQPYDTERSRGDNGKRRRRGE